MEVVEAATIQFDDEVSAKALQRILRAIAAMNPHGVGFVGVNGPGFAPLVVVAREPYCDSLRDDIRRHTQGPRYA